MFKELKVSTEEEWLKLRSKVITATDMGIILGLNPYMSVQNMIDEKKSPTKLDNSYIFLGNILEPAVVAVTNKILNTDFKLYEDALGKTFFINEDETIGATPDAYNQNSILECKSTQPINLLKWYNWPPSYYLMQLYTQLICVNKNEGLLSILSTNLTQRSKALNMPVIVFSLKRDTNVDTIVFNEVKRFCEATVANKKFRVNRKQSKILELMLRVNTTKIY